MQVDRPLGRLSSKVLHTTTKVPKIDTELFHHFGQKLKVTGPPQDCVTIKTVKYQSSFASFLSFFLLPGPPSKLLHPWQNACEIFASFYQLKNDIIFACISINLLGIVIQSAGLQHRTSVLLSPTDVSIECTCKGPQCHKDSVMPYWGQSLCGHMEKARTHCQCKGTL